MAQSELLRADTDNYNGIVIKPSHYGELSADVFHQQLSASLVVWKENGKRGVWLTILITQSELISVAAKLGFKFHHSKPDSITMTLWLPKEEPNSLPLYATHNIGVAGFVVNDKNEVLLVQEKWLRSIKLAHWKLPGGVCEPGEDLWQTAIRETFEETGIRTKFVSMLTFRHLHGYRWGIDDIYFVCLLKPLNTDINECPTEIAAAKWMDVDQYIADPNTFPTNRLVAETYKEGVKNRHMIQPTVFPHYLKDKPDVSLYQIVSGDPTQLCDLTSKEWSWSMKDTLQQVGTQATLNQIYDVGKIQRQSP